MMIRLNKKAALELSINAIVIVILAMTLLGLGLGFIRTMFKDISKTTVEVQDSMRQQILDDLRRGDKKISFPTDQINIEGGGEEIISIGVKNTEPSTLNFKIDLLIKGDSGAETGISSDKELSATADEDAFYWDDGLQTLGAGESNVYGIKLATSRRASGTRLYKIKIKECEPEIPSGASGVAEGDPCSDDIECSDGTVYFECVAVSPSTLKTYVRKDDCPATTSCTGVYTSEDFFVKII